MSSPKHRLSSSAFQRTAEKDKQPPKRVFFLAVEGTVTEIDYFKHLNTVLDTAIVRVEVLRQQKSTARNMPLALCELLDEYKALREGDLVPENGLSETFRATYTPADISRLCQNQEKEPDFKQFCSDLRVEGIDYAYRKALKEMGMRSDDDVMAVVMDRDKGSHSEATLRACMARCKENTQAFYLTNPCFEFWLLLHCENVNPEKWSGKILQKLVENKKVSEKHTYASKKLSEHAGHAKHIRRGKFDTVYRGKFALAAQRAKLFATAPDDIIDQLGTNLHQLVEKMGLTQDK